jgi:hypothetical protein
MPHGPLPGNQTSLLAGQSCRRRDMLERVFEDHPYVTLILATFVVGIGFVVAYL